MAADNATAPWPMQYDEAARPDDILACFRLILGRNPNPEEWTGHLGAVGRPLPAVVANYLASSEFERRGLFHRPSGGEIRRVSLQDFDIFAPALDEAVGRHVVHGTYEPHVASVLRQVLRPGMGMLDVGANIGVFALLAARLVGDAGYVLAVEPNAANARLLEASRRANGFDQLTICQAAASAAIGVLGLHAFDTNGTVMAVDDGSLLTATTVAGLPLDAIVPARRHIDVIKIDVEGAEHAALAGGAHVIQRCRPLIISEFSPGLLLDHSGMKGPDYLSFLTSLGYTLAVLEKNGTFAPGQTNEDIMSAYEASQVDHIDIIAHPA